MPSQNQNLSHLVGRHTPDRFEENKLSAPPSALIGDATAIESTAVAVPEPPSTAPAWIWNSGLSRLFGWTPGLSIGAKTTILATLLGVLPVIGVGWLAYRAADQAITEQIAQEKIAEATQLSNQLSQFLQERLANVKTAAGVVESLTLDGGISGITASGEPGSTTAQVLTTELTQFVQDYRTYANIALYDLQGQVIVQSQGSAREPNQGQANYFQSVLKTGQPIVSEPIAFEGDGTERLAIYVAAPVKNEADNVTAIVVAKIPVEFVGNAILRTASLQEGRTYRLVGSSGQILQNLPNTNDISPGESIATLLPLFTEIAAQKQPQAWINADRFHVYAPVSGLPHLTWSVVASTDTSIAFRPQRQLLQAIFLGTVLTALAAAGLGALLARRIIRPIQGIARTVEQLGQGEWETRIAVQGSDELAVLGENVNHMADQIQTLLQTLRQNAEQLRYQTSVLSTLARNEALIQGNAYAAAQAFTIAIAETFNIDRVGIWVYDRDRLGLTCLDQYNLHGLQHSSGAVINVTDVPAYFQTLKTEPAIIAQHVSSHPATRSLQSTQSIAPDTYSLLSIPIQISGQVVGIIQCEETSQRFWNSGEQSFVTSVANLASIVLESEFLQQEVSHLLDVVSEVEEGNLTAFATVSDRTTGLVADTFNRLLERLTDVLTQVITVAQQVSDRANQQKAMAEIVSTYTEQQAQAVTRVLQLTEQVEHTATESAAQVTTGMDSLQTMQTTVEEGQQAITTLTEGIEVLQEGTDRIMQQIKTLGEFVGLADQFVQDQSQVVSLTQTLALNASLVAARAAEQRDPKQFASVAREFDSIANQVSRLAQQTNEGLLTLEQRSSQIHSVVSIIDANIQNLGGLVRGFTQGVDQSNQVFTNVQLTAREAVAAGQVVTVSSQKIVEAAQTAAQVVREIADLAMQTAHLSQQSQMQSAEMNQLSDRLLHTVQFFQLPTLIQTLPTIPESKQP